jgi:hypothetical protein
MRRSDFSAAWPKNAQAPCIKRSIRIVHLRRLVGFSGAGMDIRIGRQELPAMQPTAVAGDNLVTGLSPVCD